MALKKKIECDLARKAESHFLLLLKACAIVKNFAAVIELELRPLSSCWKSYWKR